MTRAKAKKRARSAWRLASEFIETWVDDRVPRQSAAIAYYALFSMAPILLLIVVVTGRILGERTAEGRLHEQLEEFMGERAAHALETLSRGISLTQTSWTTAALGVATLVFGATGVFVELKDSLNWIWGLRRREGRGFVLFLKDRLFSFGMVLLVGAMLLVSMLGSSLFALFRDWLEARFELPVQTWALAGFGVAFVMETVMFALIFKVLPDRKFPWRDVWLGSLATTTLFEAGKWGLSWYLGRASAVSSAGAAGGVVLLLIWVYWSAMIVLTGAEFIEFSQRLRGKRHGRKRALDADPLPEPADPSAPGASPAPETPPPDSAPKG